MTDHVLPLESPPRWSRVDTGVVLGLVLAGIVVVLAIGRDYGRSWDEPGTTIYAQRTLRAYAGQPVEAYADLSFYGPAYLVLSELIAGGMERAVPGWTALEGRHAAYFLSFVIAVVSVYSLARGHVGAGAALMGTLLFATQPLLFGHAFINPKDVPFLGSFTAAMALGIAAARRLPRSNIPETVVEWGDRWKTIKPVGRIAGGLLVLLLVLVPLQWLPGVVPATEPGHPLVGPGLTFVSFIGIASFAAWLCPRAWRDHLIVVVGAGVAAGAATAVRIAGPLAGVLVSILLVYRLRRLAILALVAYWLALLATAYLVWPFLWGNPLGAFLEATKVMGRFPWPANVLFMGRLMPAADLPWAFGLVHYGLQLTLPALALGLIGSITLLSGPRTGISWIAGLVFCIWILLPFLASILLDSVLYDGARQLLFAIPPLFVLAAIAVERIAGHIRARGVRLALGGLVLTPGLFAIVALHPYQYVYYNELAGGLPGAYRQFELDYWGTAYREAVLALNRIAPEGAEVGVAGSWETATPYARPDMKVYGVAAEKDDLPDFLLVWTRWNLDARLWPDAPEIIAIRRDGALLARVLDLRGLKRE